MNDLRKAAEMALEGLETLWDILDDIDTASDMAKENDAWYRKRVEALQKKRWDTMITTDGYKLKGGPVEALRQALDDKPAVKSYCGGKPNYCTPEVTGEVTGDVDAVNISQERVDETVKSEHEPVAWAHIENNEIIEFETDKEECEACEYCVPLYLAPPKREWVGLDGEIPGLGLVTEEFYNGMLFAEDILREKNT